MAITLIILQTFVLLRMSWEDFSTRSIHVAWYIVLAAMVLWQFELSRSELLINAMAAGIQGLALAGFALYKTRGKKLNIFSWIGIGDLLFIALMVVHFRPVLFQASLLIALVMSLLFGWVTQSRTQPLAGIYALVIIAMQWLSYSEVALLQHKI